MGIRPPPTFGLQGLDVRGEGHLNTGLGASLTPLQRRLTGCALVLTLTLSAAPTAAQPHYPHLRIIVPSGPGGGLDTTARAMQPILHAEGLAQTSSVENVPGAGGLIGLARFVSAEHGNRDVIMMSGSGLLGAIVTNRSVLTFADVTPIARLLGEYEVLIVSAQSPLHSLSDLVRTFREDPGSISWAGSGFGGAEQVLAWRIADAVGVDPKRVNFIAFAGGGELMPSVLGGQVTVGINLVALAAPYIETGAVRVLGVSSAERLPALDAPTLREQGVDVEIDNWRGVVAPPGIGSADRERLEVAVAALVRSQAWRDALQR
jgi:putative tricarboxylic transport membrane protein